jgi:catechol 2,3-dioxygenase-like lactoylglutathione lyase family enzyme
MQLDNVTVLVTRFEETFAFYRDVLGLSVTWGEHDGNFASFAGNGGSQVAIFRRHLMAEAIGTDDLPAGAKVQDRVSLVFAVDDVDAETARVTGKGAPLVSPPTDRPDWGIRVAYVRDPDGTLIGLFRSLS